MPTEAGWRKYAIPLVILGIVVVVITLSTLRPTSKNGAIEVKTGQDYVTGLQRMVELSKNGVYKFNTGQELEQADKDGVLAAAKLMDNMNTYRPDEAAGYFQSGLLYYIVGDSDTSLARLKIAMQKGDENAKTKSGKALISLQGVIGDAHHVLSLIAFDHQDYDVALNEADISLKLVHRPNIFVARAQAEVQLKKNKEADEDLKAALALDPKCPLALRLQGFIQHLKKN